MTEQSKTPDYGIRGPFNACMFKDDCVKRMDENADLRRQVAKYEKEDAIKASVNRQLLERAEQAEAKLAAAQAENAALREDAERYRWLRSQYEDRPYAVFAWDDDCAIGGDDLDAALDAARKEQP